MGYPGQDHRQAAGEGFLLAFFSLGGCNFFQKLLDSTINISDKDGPLSTNIIIVLIADEIIKADQTA